MKNTPKISIITPSFNQAEYLEETINSVLIQNYPNLEYIIIDGGSTDRSVEIIRKYEQQLAYWVSEPDDGQSHAIRKGFNNATGDIFAWINSDDTFQPGAFQQAIDAFNQFPQAGMVYGNAWVIDAEGKRIRYWQAPAFQLQKQLFQYRYVPQQSAFFRREAYEKAGGIHNDFYYTMDFDLWLQIAARYPIQHIDQVWGNYREHPKSKTLSDRYANRPEIKQSLQRFFEIPNLPQEIKKIQPYSIAMVELHQGLGAYQQGEMDDGKKYVGNALQLAPDTAKKYRNKIIELLIAYSPAEPSQSKNFFAKITNDFEDEKMIHDPIEAAINRIRLMQIAESTSINRLEVIEALLWSIRNDLSWMLNIRIVKMILAVFVRGTVFERVVNASRK